MRGDVAGVGEGGKEMKGWIMVKSSAGKRNLIRNDAIEFISEREELGYVNVHLKSGKVFETNTALREITDCMEEK